MSFISAVAKVINQKLFTENSELKHPQTVCYFLIYIYSMLCSALPCCEFESFSGGKVLLTLNKRHVLPSQLHFIFYVTNK